MAKKRFGRKARSRAFSFKKARRSARRGIGSGIKGVFAKLPIMQFAYGVVRTPVANAIKPMTNQLPLGEYSDEVALGVIGFLLAKQSGMAGQIGKTMLDIEGYRAGELTSSKIFSGSSQGTTQVVYG